MKHTDIFQIELKAPWKWEGLAPPDDPLNELSAFELGLRKFCFEHNHKVTIIIAEESIEIFLDPDVILILEDLPEIIVLLTAGKETQIDLPESYRQIIFTPSQGKIVCTVCKFGKIVRRDSFLIDSHVVISEIRNFLNELIRLAVQQGYVSGHDAHEFLSL